MERLQKELYRSGYKAPKCDQKQGKEIVDKWISNHIVELPESIRKSFIKKLQSECTEKSQSNYIDFLVDFVRTYKRTYNEWPTALKEASN